MYRFSVYIPLWSGQEGVITCKESRGQNLFRLLQALMIALGREE